MKTKLVNIALSLALLGVIIGIVYSEHVASQPKPGTIIPIESQMPHSFLPYREVLLLKMAPEPTIVPLDLPITTIPTEEIQEDVPWQNHKDAPGKSSFKSYMDADCITSLRSPQYRMRMEYLLDQNSGIWTVDNRYCVAVGSYYTTTIGTYLDVVLENGTVIPCVLGDCKADKHTDDTNRQNPNGSVVEFIVNESSVPKRVRKRGDFSKYQDSWRGNVKEIIVYE